MNINLGFHQVLQPYLIGSASAKGGATNAMPIVAIASGKYGFVATVPVIEASLDNFTNTALWSSG